MSDAPNDDVEDVDTPESAAEEEERLLPEVQRWAAVQTNARAEKKVADYLIRLAVPHFLPMRRNRRVYGARVRESLIPLFPGYLFCDDMAITRSKLFACRRITRVLVPTEPKELETDLHQIALALRVEPTLKRCEEIPPGTPVEVTDGPLMGVKGVLVRRGRDTKLVVLVHFTGFGAEVSVDEMFVRPIEGAAS